MDNDEALVLLAAACRCQMDMLKKFIKFVERRRENEELRKENQTLPKRVQELETKT
jgi:hypothetical protein